MGYAPPDLMTVQARLALPSAAIELQRIELPDEIDSPLPAVDTYRIDFCLTPRPLGARLSFQDRWPAHRFEAMGTVYLVPPGEAVRVRSSAGVQQAVICFLRQAVLDEWLDGRFGCSLDASLDIPSMSIRRLMMKLGEEARNPGFASAAMGEALAMQIAVELGRYYLGCDKAAAGAALAPWRLALIDERLHGSRVPPTLSELAELCGISVRHLTRGFRASRGCSVGAYVRNYQIDRAKRGLARGESIKAIAHSLGFNSRSSFSHAFQKGTSVAPQQFRQNQLAERHRKIT